MKYQSLGRSDLQVSSVGLGCGNFGGVGSAPECFGLGEDEKQSFSLMDAALDMGINFFDTAGTYGGGQSEAFIGKWLRTKGSHVRARILLSSKVGSSDGADPKAPRLSRERIFQGIDATLRRLGCDHVDMYLVHETDPRTPLEETLTALDALVSQGKVRYFGASNFDAPLLASSLRASERLGIRRFECIQNSYSLLNRFDEAELIPLCRKNQIGYTPYGPLMGGLLTGKYRRGTSYPDGSRMALRPDPYLKLWNRETFEAIDKLKAMAVHHGISPAGLALAWVMNAPQVTAPVIGPRKISHFQMLQEALGVALTQDAWKEIGNLFSFAGAPR